MSALHAGVSNVLKSMKIRSGLSKLSVISQVTAVEGCPLSGVPLYTDIIVNTTVKPSLLAVYQSTH